MRRPVALLAALVVAACASPTPAPSGALASTAVSPSTAIASATPSPTLEPTPTPEPTAPPPTIAQLIGSKLMVAMDGTTPSADLLSRIRLGRIGGVILFGKNITTEAALITLTRQLQAAATAGGQPPLLISTDQEGGSIKRLPWAPPTLSPPQMGTSGSGAGARSQGQRTGAALLKDGINLDLAPVMDIPASASSFMYQQGRTWSFDAAQTASLATAFAIGLADGGIMPTVKHFPGIGRATLNTDLNAVTIKASASALQGKDLTPYVTAFDAIQPVVMLSNAWYPAYDAANAAGWSRAIAVDLLRTTMRFNGVSITDSLSGIGKAMGVSATSLALKAAAAGTDMLLLTGSEASTDSTYSALVAAAANGTLQRSALEPSYERILALRLALAR